jgi:hypothetical protein
MDEFIIIPFKLFPKHILSKLNCLDQKELAFLLQIGLAVKRNIDANPATIQINNVVSMGISEVSDFPDITQTPVKIGEIGENYVIDILKEIYNIENVSKKGHCGDVFITRKSIPIRDSHITKIRMGKLLVEVKNYSNTVPKHEVDKFHYDLKHNQHISGGLFISLKSNITSIGKDFVMDTLFLDRKVPVVYVSCVLPEVILLAAELLWAYVDMQTLNIEENDRIHTQIEKVYRKVSNLSDLLGGLGKVRISVDELRSVINKNLQKLYNDIFSVETQITNNIHSIQKIIGRITMEGENFISHPNTIMGEVCEIIPLMLEEIKKKIPDTQIGKKTTVRQSLRYILDIYFEPENWIEVIIRKKTTIWRTNKNNDQKICVVVLEFLKTKTNVKLNVTSRALESGMISIPYNIQYNEGWITFSIDATFASNVLPKLESYLQPKKDDINALDFAESN